MAYCDREDIQRVIPETELVELTSESDVVDWNVVDNAIERASAIVDSYLGVRYSVPISPVSKILEDKTTDIAVYLIYEKRAVGMTEVPEDVRKRYEDAIQWLKEVRDGKAVLSGVSVGGEEVSDTNVSGVRIKTRRKIYDESWESRF